MVTLDSLQQLFPNTKSTILTQYVDPLNQLLPVYHMEQPLRICAFLAQAGHESGGFNSRKENLNYSAEGLMKVFHKYFPTAALAKQYARKPEAIANRVYANRMGNGNEASGDGFKYCGRGLLQVTGHDNYTTCGHFLGMTLDDTVTYLETAKGAVHSACWFWSAHNLNSLADAQDMNTITIKINGGTNGLADRLELYRKAKLIFR